MNDAQPEGGWRSRECALRNRACVEAASAHRVDDRLFRRGVLDAAERSEIDLGLVELVQRDEVPVGGMGGAEGEASSREVAEAADGTLLPDEKERALRGLPVVVSAPDEGNGREAPLGDAIAQSSEGRDLHDPLLHVGGQVLRRHVDLRPLGASAHSVLEAKPRSFAQVIDQGLRRQVEEALVGVRRDAEAKEHARIGRPFREGRRARTARPCTVVAPGNQGGGEQGSDASQPKSR